MRFFKIVALRTGADRSGETDGRREKRENAVRVNMKSEEFNQTLLGDAYFFVANLTESSVSAGVISRGLGSPENRAGAFLRKLGIPVRGVWIKEITFASVRNLLRAADREDFIEDDDVVLERFDLDKLNGRFYERINFDENIIEPCGKESVYAEAGRLLSRETLLPELDRIYAGSGVSCTVGHPVHYVIETDDGDIRGGTRELLLAALYGNGRLRSGRYCTVAFKPNDDFSDASKAVYDCLYKSCIGGAVTVEYLAGVTPDNDYISGDGDTVETLCKIMKKYADRVLTVFCFPRECKDIKKKFYENLGNTSFVELKDEPAFGDRAKSFLKSLAAEHHVRTDKALTECVEPDTGYLAPDLRELFDAWYDKKLKTKIYPQYSGIASVKKEVREAKPKGSAYEELMEMTGLGAAKKVITEALDYRKAQKLFADRGMQTESMTMHMVFTGNPGTAKTTVARLFARIMKDNELLSRGHLVEVGRGDLVGKYVGWTAPTIQRKFREAEGGVLFIDEAYSLVDDRNGSYGDEAISTIVQEMENHRDDTVVIFAGYPKEMEVFLEKNPGLRSRIAYRVPFADYSAGELCEIAKLIAKKKGMILSREALEKMSSIFENARLNPDFGNGRFVRNIIDKAKMAQASRLLRRDPETVSKTDVATILPEDIEQPLQDRPEKRAIGFSV